MLLVFCPSYRHLVDEPRAGGRGALHVQLSRGDRRASIVRLPGRARGGSQSALPRLRTGDAGPVVRRAHLRLWTVDAGPVVRLGHLRLQALLTPPSDAAADDAPRKDDEA
jgi:hypothetical protein